ncbi:hypothetical protein Q5424_21045 [Conexibacter sp. JD483]|uniref:hypothetical protein n=1 Tax=unclassified Conexibacter TaxID=2627773 RepID=UPI00271B32DE|nr:MULTISPECIES: hypothetical protein [unclassified Conexibacter]MDO8187018.1 hypothetical protein [Conexibacter sp. CPCC 205706]MDO8200664.1 hypothetical protein [Conexibacter sp. CPCC 205762]MDR9371600.1 hypothetical protein [Conexibacter sp. JD483]
MSDLGEAMRIGGIFASETANAHYRAILPLRALEARGHRILWPPPGADAAAHYEVPACDALLLHRGLMPAHLDFVERLRAARIAVIWDNDDDIASLPKLTRNWNGRSRRETKQDFERTVEIARAASLMTTPSRRIAEIYGERGACVQVIENALTARELARPESRRRRPGVTIGYVGGLEHFDDVRKLKLAKVLERLLRERDDVRVVSIGVSFGFRSPAYEERGQIPVQRLIGQEREFAIGLAPLADTPFNRARSNVKLKEYATAGAMWLASPIGPYADLGPQQGGLLVGDGDWHAALSALLDDRQRLSELRANAVAWARTQTVEQLAPTWEAAFSSCVRELRGRART